jgi:hypothetical protein
MGNDLGDAASWRVTDEKARRAVKPAGFVFSDLIAHDRKHRLDRFRLVTMEEHRPRRLNALLLNSLKSALKLAMKSKAASVQTVLQDVTCPSQRLQRLTNRHKPPRATQRLDFHSFALLPERPEPRLPKTPAKRRA